MIERPPVAIEFDGPGGNSLAIIGACQRAARNAGWPRDTIEAFREEAMASDRDHLVDMVFEHFEVQQVVAVVAEVDRDSVC